MDDITKKAIDCVFEILKDMEKVKKIDELQNRLGFTNDFFSFSSFLDANQDRLVNFLDWFFWPISAMHPESDFGGLASYAIYDAATPYLDDKPYNLKERTDFEAYIAECIKRKIEDKSC